MTTSLATELATWALDLEPTAEDLSLARRSLLDTVAVTVAGRDHHVARLTEGQSDALRFGAVGHVLDFDDLHMESTAHISVVCVPAVLLSGGDAKTYLAAAGVMARLGVALGWPHYAAGWHITCTTGAIAAATAAGLSIGLDRQQLTTAMALAVPASGGVQRAFGTDAKSLQVGFAVDAGVRAAELAARGATADPAALESWLRLMGAVPSVELTGPAVPGSLAIKIYPACYALQRPISCLSELRAQTGFGPAEIDRVVVRTLEATIAPLIHSRPRTGLEGKFSLEYAVATAVLDEYSGFAAFDDDAIARPEAQALLRRVAVDSLAGGSSLLDGVVDIEVRLVDGRRVRSSLASPPGSPNRPPTDAEFEDKLRDCLTGTDIDPRQITWSGSAELIRAQLDAAASTRR